MFFEKYLFEDLLPNYLTSPEKDRLRKGLEQFKNPDC